MLFHQHTYMYWRLLRFLPSVFSPHLSTPSPASLFVCSAYTLNSFTNLDRASFSIFPPSIEMPMCHSWWGVDMASHPFLCAIRSSSPDVCSAMSHHWVIFTRRPLQNRCTHLQVWMKHLQPPVAVVAGPRRAVGQ